MNNRKLLLGARIKELRKKAGLSQDELSEKIGIDGKYLSRIEVGKRSPSLETLQGIADALQVDMKDLFDYLHHDTDGTTPHEIESLTLKATADELKLIHRLIKAVLK
jgi:transcriptional regulator with XRE-family HTH domain